MEAIIFCGIQATGKTSFYAGRFLKTHVRISLDLLRTRNKENQFLELCLSFGQKFVVDNTNLTAKDRVKYLEKARQHRFKTIGYYFESVVSEALIRNRQRKDKELIPDKGIFASSKKMQDHAARKDLTSFLK